MAVDLLLGLQWGDEGKGKIVDVLTKNYDIIARFQGGPNAGHTLEFDGIKHVLHTIPSGIFHKNAINIVGNGVVIDPVIFKKELDRLSKYLINKDYKITLMGHTDTDSTKTYNKALSLKRANSVKQYLVQTGCDPMQIGTVGYGEEDPLNNEQTTTEKYLNRRVEYCVVMNRN